MNFELLADCLSGVYMKGALNLSNQVNEQGVSEVIRTSGHFADPSHGRAVQRILATLTGLNGASPAQCSLEYEKP
jgi:hypothetical protein